MHLLQPAGSFNSRLLTTALWTWLLPACNNHVDNPCYNLVTTLEFLYGYVGMKLNEVANVGVTVCYSILRGVAMKLLLTVDITGTIITLQAFGKVVRQIHRRLPQ